MIVPPSPVAPITDPDGNMTQEMQTWTGLVSNPVLSGSGSPENVVEATEKTFYMDTAAGSGSVLYIKRDPDIGGDKKQGWILV